MESYGGIKGRQEAVAPSPGPEVLASPKPEAGLRPLLPCRRSGATNRGRLGVGQTTRKGGFRRDPAFTKPSLSDQALPVVLRSTRPSCFHAFAESTYRGQSVVFPVFGRWTVFLVFVSLTLAPAVAMATAPQGTHPPTASPPSLTPLPLSARPGGSSPVYYEQEGATISSLDGSTNFGFTAMYAHVTLQASPYSTAYELNGLSSSGDWYQATVGDNWPGCPGFVPLFEVWANNATSQPPICYPFSPFSLGETVTLGLNFTGTQVCMSAFAISQPQGAAYCVVQPNPGGVMFVPLQAASNANGYFTGPMTEVVDPTAATCLNYAGLPEVSYGFSPGVYISSYVAWSDEFNVSGTICYGHQTGVVQQPPGDFAPAYVEATNGSKYGPHWESAQNTSGLVPGTWWNFSTDSLPVTFSLSRKAADVGQLVTLLAGSEAGAPPFSYQFQIDDAVVSSGVSAMYDWRPSAPGVYVLRVTVTDPGGSFNVTSQNETIVVSSRPLVGPITTVGNSSSLVAGASIQLEINVTGGSGGLVVNWFGLPPGCAEVTLTATCGNLPVGEFAIDASVTDSNGVSAYSNATVLTVNPPLNLTLFASASSGSVGQNVTFVAYGYGGTQPLTFAWAGLPPGCREVNQSVLSEVQCTPRSSGILNILVSVTDSGRTTVFASMDYSVTPLAQTSASAPWLDNNWLSLSLLAVVIVLAVLLLVLVARRRSEPTTRPPSWDRPVVSAGFAPGPPPLDRPGLVPEWDERNVPHYWEVPPPLETHCRRCENENPPGSLYCARCGIPLGGEDRAPTSSSP